jgi:Immunity protein 22
MNPDNIDRWQLTKYHEGFVSIWASIVPLAEIPDDYFEERYSETEDIPQTKFCGDFDFWGHDHDQIDANCSLKGPESFERLIGECSFSKSYISEATKRARKLGIETTQQVMLLYDLRYDLKPSVVETSPYLRFVGSFPYDSNASSAFEVKCDEK